jgi:hypothetical protein
MTGGAARTFSTPQLTTLYGTSRSPVALFATNHLTPSDIRASLLRLRTMLGVTCIVNHGSLPRLNISLILATSTHHI